MKVKHTIVIVQLDNGKFHQVVLKKTDEKLILGIVESLCEMTLKVNEKPLEGMEIEKLPTKKTK